MFKNCLPKYNFLSLEYGFKTNFDRAYVIIANYIIRIWFQIWVCCVDDRPETYKRQNFLHILIKSFNG